MLFSKGQIPKAVEKELMPPAGSLWEHRRRAIGPANFVIALVHELDKRGVAVAEDAVELVRLERSPPTYAESRRPIF